MSADYSHWYETVRAMYLRSRQLRLVTPEQARELREWFDMESPS